MNTRVKAAILHSVKKDEDVGNSYINIEKKLRWKTDEYFDNLDELRRDFEQVFEKDDEGNTIMEESSFLNRFVDIVYFHREQERERLDRERTERLERERLERERLERERTERLKRERLELERKIMKLMEEGSEVDPALKHIVQKYSVGKKTLSLEGQHALLQMSTDPERSSLILNGNGSHGNKPDYEYIENQFSILDAQIVISEIEKVVWHDEDERERKRRKLSVGDVEMEDKKDLSSSEGVSMLINHLKETYGKEEIPLEEKPGLISGFGSDFMFIGRADHFDQSKLFVHKYLQKLDDLEGRSSRLDKKDVVIPLVGCNPGVGKTKCALELSKSFKNDSRLNETYHVLPVGISLGNSYRVGESERGLELVQNVALRVLFFEYCSIKKLPKVATIGSFDRFLLDIKEHHFDLFSLSLKSTLLAICKDKRKTTTKPVLFVLITDEYQVERSRLKSLLSEFGGIMQEKYEELVFFPFFYGTQRFMLLKTIDASQLTAKTLNFGLIRDGFIFNLLDELAQRYEVLKRWRTCKVFRKYLSFIGGYMKSFCTFVEGIVQLTTLDNPSGIKNAYEKARETLEDKLIRAPPSWDVKFVISTCMRSKSVIGDEFFMKLEEKGEVMIDQESGKVFMVPILLQYYITYQNDDVFLKWNEVFYKPKDEYSFEDFCVKYMCFRYFCFPEETNMKLSEVFSGAYVSSNLKDVEIVFKEKRWAAAKHKFPEKIEGMEIFEDIENGIGKVKWNSLLHVILNAASAEFADGWTVDKIVDLDDFKFLILCLQMKFLRSLTNDSTLSMDDILKEHSKNQTKFSHVKGKEDYKLVTVIFTDRRVGNNTKMEIEKVDDLIVICRDNFHAYFGETFLRFALLKTCFLNLNTLSKVELKRFKGISDVGARAIIGGRPYSNDEEVNEELKGKGNILGTIKTLGYIL